MTDEEWTELIQQAVQAEWDQFQEVNNEGGPANCQGNWPVFFQMRASQFLTWNPELLSSYVVDLAQARETGRNLLTEKYGLMMDSTDHEYFQANLEDYMPRISTARRKQQETIIAQQLAWAVDFHEQWPHLGENMRVLRTADDTRDTTSFETYLRAELTTYSQQTLDLYQRLIESIAHEGRNITEMTVLNTVRMGGFESLAAADAAQVGA